MRKLLAAAVIGVSVLSIGCSATMPVQTGGMIKKTSGEKRIYASVSSFNFLGLVPMSLETAEKATQQLQAKCNGGDVTSITSIVKYTWLFIGQSEKLEVSGYCA